MRVSQEMQQPMGNAPSGLISALLLDDSDFDRKRIVRMSRDLGFHMDLHEVPSIEDLKVALDQDHYDLIILDYHLPQGCGLSALDLIQQHSGNRDAATIMITGDVQTSTAVTALKRGCRDYVAKNDLTPDLWRQTILSSLNSRRSNHYDPALDSRYGGTSAPDENNFALTQVAIRDMIQPMIREAVQEALTSCGRTLSLPEQSVSDMMLSSVTEVDEFVFAQFKDGKTPL